jgi:hypothetical protein
MSKTDLWWNPIDMYRVSQNVLPLLNLLSQIAYCVDCKGQFVNCQGEGEGLGLGEGDGLGLGLGEGLVLVLGVGVGLEFELRVRLL